MRVYVAAEIIGITVGRLQTLERGTIRQMPSKQELRMISKLYGITEEVLIEKARDFIREQVTRKKPKAKYGYTTGAEQNMPNVREKPHRRRNVL